jgi:DNA-binding response OmpR family regulator
MNITTTSHVILIADEDELTRRFLGDNLIADGLSARTAGSAQGTRTLLSQDPVDLLLVDVNGQTLELLDALRGGELAASSPDTLALVLTGSQDKLHRVRLLERGADDVQLKPFSYPELRARIQALLRRRRPPATPRLVRAGTLAIDPQTHTAQVNGQPMQLTPFECRLLVTLARQPEQVFTREQLLCSIWGINTGRSRTLDSHATRLRGKLRDAGAGDLIHNVWGVGYAFTKPPTDHRAA